MPTDKAVLKEVRDHCINASAHIKGPFVVTPEEQKQRLDALRGVGNLEQFFFVLNLQDYKTRYGHGIHRWLGYSDNMTMDAYMSIQHPATVRFHIEYGKILVSKITKGEISADFMHSSFTGLQAMQNIDGRYLLVKRTSSIFQYNQKREVTEYINVFNIIRTYENEPYQFGSFNLSPSVEQAIRQYIRERLPKILPFSDQEFQLMEIYARQPTLTEKEASALLKSKKSEQRVQPNTIKTYKQRICVKAKNYFHRPFKNMDEVVDYMKEQYFF